MGLLDSVDSYNRRLGFVSLKEMDRISGLSDELLIKILLLLPTKVAVSTSILSKRWEYLWMWLPKLHICRDGSSPLVCASLRCFLDRNLPLYRAPVIERFRLEFYNSFIKPENINMWVVLALSHCIRELEIGYVSHLDKPNILPSNLYTSKSLVILRLWGSILVDVPRMVFLPSLKTLKLHKVKYFKKETLQRLLSNCPILEDLLLDLHPGDTTRKLSVVVPSLQRLTLRIPDNHHIDGFTIETPSLKYFKLRLHCSNDHYCLIEHMPHLIEAHLDVELHNINSLIGSITSVNRLTICSQTILDEGFVFNQLEHLEVCLCTVLFSNQLVRLLKASSKLKRLDISLMHGHVPHQDMDGWNQPSTVPECMLSGLQSLSWSKYTGKPHERDIAVYILTHALHLKTATIKSSSVSAVRKHEMLKELALSSRASTTCQLMFD